MGTRPGVTGLGTGPGTGMGMGVGIEDPLQQVGGEQWVQPLPGNGPALQRVV